MTSLDLFPVTCSLDEYQTAHEIFLAAYRAYAPYESRETAIRIALDAVWSNARKYQMNEQPLIEG